MARIPLQPETRAARGMSLTVTALMVALGIIALGGATALRHVDLRWRAALADRWTVELTAPDIAKPVPQADIDRAIATLRATPGIVEARLIAPDEVRRLLQPWLGDSAAIAELPLPALIDLTIDPARRPAPATVARRVAEAAPEARLDDHGAWTRDLARLAETGEALALALFVIIAIATALTIAATARARLAINRPEIELLHTIGATDGYIARQFQASAFRAALLGAVLGALFAGGALVGLLAVGRSLTPLIPEVTLDPVDLAVLAVVPVAAILLATLVTRSTALALLRRLP